MKISSKKFFCAQEGVSGINSDSKMQHEIIAKPFLKWAGGKRQLLKQIEPLLPAELENGLITKYVEPFLGGGAMFFYMAQNYNFDEIRISDANNDLIMTYQVVRDCVDSLITMLADMESAYLRKADIDRERYYYLIREKLNQERLFIDDTIVNESWTERAAQFIFLNRTTFNGLNRVNSKGEMNSSFGKCRNPCICDAVNLRAVSKVLQDVVITTADFAECERIIDDGTLVYFDPPYIPISNTANFTGYTATGFDDKEQKRLASLYARLVDNGTYAILSNSGYRPFDVNDFIRENYASFTINTLKARRSINCRIVGQEKIDEVLITNYAIHSLDPRTN